MSQIQQVKEASDIIQVIGERVPLQRSGTNFRANCPFHSEKSPSFFVNEQFQRYRCFGCGENGDVFTFLEKYEGMTFNEALKHLADKANITLESFHPTGEDADKEKILAVLNLAKEYFHFLLTQHEVGEPARQYLKNRGVTQESIKLFQLGYSLPAWDGLVAYLRDKKKYDLAILEKAGLVIKGKTGRYYDRFRSRIMFPLANHRGQIVGFSGRTLLADAKEAKYINSPETLVYHKSQMLYGYSELFQEIRKKAEVVVVEGEFDVISSAQAHVNNVVAIKGSAITQEHFKLLSRAAHKVLLSLDADSAGVEATRRAISLAQGTNLELRVVSLRHPSGKKQDPDEVARTEPAAWRSAVKGAISVYDFLMQAALGKYDPETPEGKRDIMTELGPVLNTIQLVVEQDVYIKKLAAALHVKEELVRTDLLNLSRHQKLQPGRSRAEATPEPEVKPPVELSRREKLERFVLFLLFQSEAADFPSRLTQVQDVTWSVIGAKQLVDRVRQVTGTFHLERFIKSLPEDLNQLLFGITIDPVFTEGAQSDLDKEWGRILKDLKTETLKTELTQVETELETLDQVDVKTPEQEQRQIELLQRIITLRKRG